MAQTLEQLVQQGWVIGPRYGQNDQGYHDHVNGFLAYPGWQEAAADDDGKLAIGADNLDQLLERVAEYRTRQQEARHKPTPVQTW